MGHFDGEIDIFPIPCQYWCMGGFNPKFDIDLRFGQSGENWLKWLGDDAALVEVKTERGKWMETGMLAIEYECRGKPSGIAVTAADYWIHLLSRNGKVVGGFIWPVTDLRVFLREVFRDNPRHLKLAVGGDGGASRLILVPLYVAGTISLK